MAEHQVMSCGYGCSCNFSHNSYWHDFVSHSNNHDQRARPAMLEVVEVSVARAPLQLKNQTSDLTGLPADTRRWR